MIWVENQAIRVAIEVTGKPENGCYIFGLLMEGARWDDDLMAVNESHPKVLYDVLPTMGWGIFISNFSYEFYLSAKKQHQQQQRKNRKK